MNKKQTVTIGIPAYNEELNIRALIRDLFRQKEKNYSIQNIFVSSDGSNDKTVSIIRKMNNRKIRVFDNKDRKGIARGLNQILETANTDIVVTLDADIRIKDNRFIEKLILPITTQKADLTSSAIREYNPKSFFAKTLEVSMRIKSIIFDQFNYGNNLYTCHGLARAYSKKLYKKLRFPISVGNDMYSYLYCVAYKYTYAYAKDAIAWYRLPETYSDHKKQSLRFFVSGNEQVKYFGKKLIDESITIPRDIYKKSMFKVLPIIIQNPLKTMAYYIIQLTLRFESKSHIETDTWDIALSSKKI
jgi:glycosyltransferase involved in cell wall biosynthesis